MGRKHMMIYKLGQKIFCTLIKAIEEGEKKEKYKMIQESFYNTFIKSAKKEEKKSAHPIYYMFNEIGNKV